MKAENLFITEHRIFAYARADPDCRIDERRAEMLFLYIRARNGNVIKKKTSLRVMRKAIRVYLYMKRRRHTR